MKLKIVEINPDIKQAVDDNDGYCPCLIEKNKDTKCMCKDFREQQEPGECHCGRFGKVIDKSYMTNLDNWDQVSRGIYILENNVTGLYYEICILVWSHVTDVMSAHSSLYLVGDHYGERDSYFSRNLVCTGPLCACLQAAFEHCSNSN